MKGKAVQLAANRSLSAFVVASLVFSALAGLMFLSDSRPTAGQVVGDLIVAGGTYVVEYDQWVDGNIEVRDYGELIVRNATLSVISNNDPMLIHSIAVGVNGKITLEHGTITTYLDQINPWPFLDLIVKDGGELVATDNSLLKFPGRIVIENGASVSLTDTVITSLDASDVYKYVIGSAGVITFDSADDGPAIGLNDSYLELYDSSILALPEYASDLSAASNLTLDGSSTLLAVNSYVGVDFGPVLGPSSWYTHNVLVLNDLSHAHLYGAVFETYTGLNADRAPAVVADSSTTMAMPTAKKPTDTTGEPISDLQVSDDGATYHVAPGTLMAIESFGAGPSAAVDAAMLYVRYSVDAGYDGTQSVTWNLQGGTPASTGITPMNGETGFVVRSYDLHAAGVTTTDQIAALDVSFRHDGTTADVQFDSVLIAVTVGPGTYIYRWLNVTVGDEYGVPIPGADISAVFSDSVAFGGESAFYYTLTGGTNSLPPQQILDYMGKDAITFGVTESNGAALVPYLTDIIGGSSAPNSQFVGVYDISGTATVGGTPYTSTETYAFPAYPAMRSSDQHFEYTVDVIGVSVESPDTARWLVVPPNLTIEDITYYHAGDVIVAAGGTLTFRNAELQLVQAVPNQRTVYVDGTLANPARLIFEGSAVVSSMPINFIVQGYATLEVVGSTLQGVNIIALEHATVILENSVVDGAITTAWDSYAQIVVTDSILAQTPVLSGYALGMFTNTSVPSITVQNDARGLIYRWIHVRVYDGGFQPLPGANVSMRYFVNNSPAGSVLSNSAGIASLKSLGTILTASGSTFIGNYRVNTTYTFDSTNYYGESEIAVGVMPYTEPLGQNATYAVMVVPSALPDLVIHETGDVVCNPASPAKGENTTVNATVRNEGVSWAYNVLVEFYDDTDNDTVVTDADRFSSTVVPLIAPNTSVVVTAYWIAGYPLADWHKIVVKADRLNTVVESDETPAMGYALVWVKKLPDLVVGSSSTDIYTQPLDPVLDTPCYLYAAVKNNGDAPATNVTVRFYDGEVNLSAMLGNTTLTSIGPFSQAVVSIQWTPTSVGEHQIIVVASAAWEELDDSNNQGARAITVLNLPDLVISGLSFVPGSVTSGGSQVVVNAEIYNTGVNPAPVTNPKVDMYIGAPSGTPVATQVVQATVEDLVVPVSFTYLVPIVSEDTVFDVYLVVTQTQYPGEAGASYDNNVIHGSLTVLDSRPNLKVDSTDIRVVRGGTNYTNAVFGDQVSVVVTVHNTGGQPATFRMSIGIRSATGEPNYTLLSQAWQNISGNNAILEVTFPWTVNLTEEGTYTLWVYLDPTDSISEKNEADNFAGLPFTINRLEVDVDLKLDRSEYDAGQTILVTQLFVYYAGTNPEVGVPNLDGIMFALYDGTGNVIPETVTDIKKTNADGVIEAVMITIPEDIETGTYFVRASILGETFGDTQGQVAVSGLAEGPAIPMFVWYIVIGAVAAVVIGFTVYTLKYGLGKLVECGECGAFIPAASKRCPKCGVEFEVGTMKCSECGAWIPAESPECPNCGVKFVGEAEAEEDYLARMRKEYDEMVSKYRELAKAELGKKFNEKQFEDWWKTQPAYISFDDWLAKEEEKRKEGLVACPVCGTPNPKEATVCHKCGTVFGVAKEEGAPPKGKVPPGAVPPSDIAPKAKPMEAPVEMREVPKAAAPGAPPPAAAPKMVIRRPIDRKVVPKKIIKTPLGAGEEGEESKEKEEEGQ